MIDLLVYIFIISTFCIFYAYFGYPMLLWILSRLKKQECLDFKRDVPRKIALIISCSKEPADMIKDKIYNTKSLLYPKDKLKVILAFDGYDANNIHFYNDIISCIPEGAIISKSWSIVLSPEIIGKEKMQKKAVEEVDADIFAFTDAASTLELDVLYKMNKRFGDPEIGTIDGISVIDNSNGVEALYLKYENKIRGYESIISSCVSCGGSLFATRKELIDPLFSKETQSDFSSALVAVQHGYKAIIDMSCPTHFKDLKNKDDEGKRKYRTILRGMNTLWEYKALLNPFKYGIFSFQIWSHKIMKWAVPFFAILAWISNGAIALLNPSDIIWLMIFIIQNTFYCMAILGHIYKIKAFKIFNFLLISNKAAYDAGIDFFKGKKITSWSNSVR